MEGVDGKMEAGKKEGGEAESSFTATEGAFSTTHRIASSCCQIVHSSEIWGLTKSTGAPDPNNIDEHTQKQNTETKKHRQARTDTRERERVLRKRERE